MPVWFLQPLLYSWFTIIKLHFIIMGTSYSVSEEISGTQLFGISILIIKIYLGFAVLNLSFPVYPVFVTELFLFLNNIKPKFNIIVFRQVQKKQEIQQ